jgi:MoaA/NifB/PqqE/SkfB family radical SAM enzyme
MIVIQNISIDASSVCQLRCPECSTTKGIIKNGIIGSGFLKFENFKTIIEQNPDIKQIELSNWGEIFLNPEIDLIIEYSNSKRIKLTAGNGTNFNKINESTLESLVKYRFGYLNISIDGATQETYSKYRIGGNFEQVISNIRRLNYYKSIFNSQLPKLSWQFIIFGHNERELPAIKELCQELNMVFYPKLNHSTFSPIVDKEFVRKESGLGVATREEYKVKYKKQYKRPCCQLWYSPQINWDGKLLGCCVNKWISFGNVFDKGLSNCLNSNLYKRTISVLEGKNKITDDIPCFHCATFKHVQENPISYHELSEYTSFIHPAEMQGNI